MSALGTLPSFAPDNGTITSFAAFFDNGGMDAVFAKCNLVFNTNDQTDKGKKDDVGYITAAQTASGRGLLLYNCTVTSTIPGVNPRMPLLLCHP